MARHEEPSCVFAVVAVLALGVGASCDERNEPPIRELAEVPTPSLARGAQPVPAAVTDDVGAEDGDDARWAPLRARMVESQIAGRDVTDPRVLGAMRRVPRHRFVPTPYRESSYTDQPLPIGHDQTISQPYIVGAMSELLEVEPGDKVLEIGTGSGYQAAVLAEMGCEVYTIEIVAPLGRSARVLLARLGYERVHTRVGDGYRGWPEHAPFDAIILTAAPPAIPEPLEAQLAVGGHLVAPVGVGYQELVVLTRTARGLSRRTVFPVAFVPMTGEAQGD